jgi:hypothetical protein
LPNRFERPVTSFQQPEAHQVILGPLGLIFKHVLERSRRKRAGGFVKGNGDPASVIVLVSLVAASTG